MTIGNIAFLGSGETSLAGGRIFEQLARQIREPLRVAVLETPAGFELNSSQVAGKVAEFFKTRLANYKPRVEVIAARRKNSAYSPDDPEICAPLLRANLIFMGPGSPTYAIRQLQNSLAWEIIRARHRLGATLVFASAATIAVGAFGLPVYEIYKVGQDMHYLPGLDLFAEMETPLSIVPHWNNTDGGADVDTSRCFVGMERFSEWCAMLPKGHTVLGLDEHTGIIMDFSNRKCQVEGVSSVSLVRECDPLIHPSGVTFPLTDIGPLLPPDELSTGISATAWEMVCEAAAPIRQVEESIPPQVTALAQARQEARARKDWSASDELRRKIGALGWVVQDTAEGWNLSKV
jgi:cyanophycinase-like exopeptidase